MSNPALFKLTKPTGELRRAWFQIITTFLLSFVKDDRVHIELLMYNVNISYK